MSAAVDNSPPEGPGVRHDSGISVGSVVPLDYDPMLAKLIAWGPDREIARRRLVSALGEYLIEGILTSIPFFRALLEEPRFVSGDFDTHFSLSNMLHGRIPYPKDHENNADQPAKTAPDPDEETAKAD